VADQRTLRIFRSANADDESYDDDNSSANAEEEEDEAHSSRSDDGSSTDSLSGHSYRTRAKLDGMRTELERKKAANQERRNRETERDFSQSFCGASAPRRTKSNFKH
jgi:hypothetical protein